MSCSCIHLNTSLLALVVVVVVAAVVALVLVAGHELGPVSVAAVVVVFGMAHCQRQCRHWSSCSEHSGRLNCQTFRTHRGPAPFYS